MNLIIKTLLLLWRGLSWASACYISMRCVSPWNQTKDCKTYPSTGRERPGGSLGLKGLSASPHWVALGPSERPCVRNTWMLPREQHTNSHTNKSQCFFLPCRQLLLLCNNTILFSLSLYMFLSHSVFSKASQVWTWNKLWWRNSYPQIDNSYTPGLAVFSKPKSVAFIKMYKNLSRKTIACHFITGFQGLKTRARRTSNVVFEAATTVMSMTCKDCFLVFEVTNHLVLPCWMERGDSSLSAKYQPYDRMVPHLLSAFSGTYIWSSPTMI